MISQRLRAEVSTWEGVTWDRDSRVSHGETGSWNLRGMTVPDQRWPTGDPCAESGLQGRSHVA